MSEEKSRILVVDDERSNINVLGTILSERYDVSIALNGARALQLAVTNPQPDMILLDIQMPAMDGYEVCRRLKAAPETQNIPVIFITVMTTEEDECRGLELGAVDYITKPFRPSIVLARIKVHLELKKKRDLLERLSTQDVLTGLANRRRFQDYLGHEWRRSVRAETALSLILLDIDHFKQFNDHYGHLLGDDCLRQVAQAIVGRLKRATDLVARYGGEEFVCVLPDTSLEGAIKVAKKLHAAVCALAIPHEYSSVASHVTVSLGIATTVPTPRSEPTSLLQDADQRLYAAKKAGRNRLVWDASLDH